MGDRKNERPPSVGQNLNDRSDLDLRQRLVLDINCTRQLHLGLSAEVHRTVTQSRQRHRRFAAYRRDGVRRIVKADGLSGSNRAVDRMR